MANIQEEIKILRKLHKKLEEVSDNTLLPLLAYKYIYIQDPEDLRYSDFKKIIVDGPNDGGIDAIFNHPEDDRLILLQSKNYSQDISAKDTILNAFRKINATLKDLKNLQTANYNKKLRSAWSNLYDEDKSIEVVFLTSANITKELITTIKNKLDQEEMPFQATIYTKHDLEFFIDNSENSSPWVQSATLDIDKNNKCLCPNNDNGVIVNITATSLKRIYDIYNIKLFQQNFRYFIKDKKVDPKIVESIQKNSNLFWFLNNGIIIACKDFRLDGDKLRLEDFSIINGCQTTSLIGEHNFSNDFYLTCKVVKAPSPEEQDAFVSKIAEASNRQKAIKPRDLKSTDKAMRKLQMDLKKEIPAPSIFLEIRRGEKAPRNAEKLKNDLYGQLVLSFMLQQPAKARNSSRTMFDSPSLYSAIFKRKNFDKEAIVDLWDLYKSFMDYKDKKLKDGNFSIEEAETMIEYIHFFVLAIAGLIVKVKRGLFDITAKDCFSSPEGEKKLQEDNIQGRFLNKEIMDHDTILFGFFDCILEDLTNIFKDHKNSIGTEANFTKVTEHYPKLVLPFIKDRFFINDYQKKLRKDFLNLFK